MLLNIVIAWLFLDMVALLIVLHDYHQWHRNVEPINDEENIPETSVDRLPAA
jgi:hypothetical protein